MMNLTMATEDKTPRKVGRPRTGRDPKTAVTIRLPPAMLDALALQLAETRRNLSVEVQIALEEYLAKHGKWPPSKTKAGR